MIFDENKVNRIDFHMHTTVSDGTDTPEQIIGIVRDAGITLFSVADHDSIKSSVMIKNLLTENDPGFFSGVEFSCRDDEGKYHILGYGYDTNAESLKKITEFTHNNRMKKARLRLEYIKADYGFEFPREEIENLLRMDNPGKPHIGNLMVKYGYAPTKEIAIKDYINKLRVRTDYIRPETAIEGILAAGGVPVLAHPAYGDGDQLIIGDELDKRIKKLKDFGLEGVECFYSGFTVKLIRDAIGLADKYGLYITAGSDYHGSNKMVELGDTGLDYTKDFPDSLHKFIRRVMQ
ncbi:MAG: PHP domain-containing protein [Lachnospiraceae bacterium]|nr:PHP domain-containing protein [Lachnospiraceae bacterium]